MRHALIADLHGRHSALRALLSAAADAGVDDVVIAGDYLECLISKAQAPTARPERIDDVVEVDPRLWEALRSCTLVRGNQEERIGTLVRGLPGVTALRPLLVAPARIRVGRLTVTHGHTFDWSRHHDRWVPTLDDALPAEPVVVFGHSHQALVTVLADDGTGWRYAGSHTAPDAPIGFSPQSRYLVNLAPAKDSPLWMLYDDETGTISWQTL